ncbi:helix-turn-helix domain-containing protein [Pseudomonas plecoglossicida]|uniref:helix-turn-helix domain-containing protein n=1 Tax=Pseudomonas plecoglossicida TaxID=70775 RepID=UPI0015E3691D|nr:helix-turn-helix domain-containing protein [Pseudomonas plecoglossicida]MBA1322708.1 AraC family transcriptional regulator [Pseudomonas plecoglossicida]
MAETNHYTTLAVSPARRFDYWREVVCHHCLSADSNPSSQSDFDGALQVNGIGPPDITTLSSPLHHWVRSEQHLRSDPAEDIWLGFTLDGHGEIEQHTRKASLSAGNLFLYDATQPFRFSLGGTENHLIRIPRPLLAQRLPRIGDFTALLQDEGISRRYSNTIIDLLVLSLELQDLKTTHQELDLYGRIMNHIQRHLTEPELLIETIAVAHHVSTRTVTRAFARHQNSPVAEIWKERLNASRAAIECGQVRSVSQAALESGFSDFSHFSHAFRKAFGVAPHTLLRRNGA